MSIIQEFKEFAIKGNMMDLAIGVIIGGAFSKIIDSLVKDIHYVSLPDYRWWRRFYVIFYLRKKLQSSFNF